MHLGTRHQGHFTNRTIISHDVNLVAWITMARAQSCQTITIICILISHNWWWATEKACVAYKLEGRRTGVENLSLKARRFLHIAFNFLCGVVDHANKELKWGWHVKHCLVVVGAWKIKARVTTMHWLPIFKSKWEPDGGAPVATSCFCATFKAYSTIHNIWF